MPSPGRWSLTRLLPDVPWAVPQWGWAEFRATARTVVARSGDVLGQDFASRVAARAGVRHGIPVAQGRVAVEIGLRALGVEPGDDVVLPSYVCASLLEGVERSGASPVFADVGLDLNVTRETIAQAITPRTTVVIVAHLYGRPAEIAGILDVTTPRGIAVLDDAAQAFGSLHAGRPIGGFGAAGIVSCGPGKPLAGPGGGVFITNDDRVADRARRLAAALPSSTGARQRLARFWITRRGRRYWQLASRIGRRLRPRRREPVDEYRCTRIAPEEAALGLVQLERLDANAAARRANAARILEQLGGLARYSVSDLSASSVMTKLVLVMPEDQHECRVVIEALKEAGIEARRGYKPLHLGRPRTVPLPNTEELWKRVVSIPIEIAVRRARLLQERIAKLCG